MRCSTTAAEMTMVVPYDKDFADFKAAMARKLLVHM
jgi:hypothetical protein